MWKEKGHQKKKIQRPTPRYPVNNRALSLLLLRPAKRLRQRMKGKQMAEGVCFWCWDMSGFPLFFRSFFVVVKVAACMPRLSLPLGNNAFCWMHSGTAEQCLPHRGGQPLKAASDSQWRCSPSLPPQEWPARCATQLPPATQKGLHVKALVKTEKIHFLTKDFSTNNWTMFCE